MYTKAMCESAIYIIDNIDTYFTKANKHFLSNYYYGNLREKSEHLKKFYNSPDSSDYGQRKLEEFSFLSKFFKILSTLPAAGDTPTTQPIIFDFENKLKEHLFFDTSFTKEQKSELLNDLLVFISFKWDKMF